MNSKKVLPKVKLTRYFVRVPVIAWNKINVKIIIYSLKTVVFQILWMA